jgi:predicted transcriptional regulator
MHEFPSVGVDGKRDPKTNRLELWHCCGLHVVSTRQRETSTSDDEPRYLSSGLKPGTGKKQHSLDAVSITPFTASYQIVRKPATNKSTLCQ